MLITQAQATRCGLLNIAHNEHQEPAGRCAQIILRREASSGFCSSRDGHLLRVHAGLTVMHVSRKCQPDLQLGPKCQPDLQLGPNATNLLNVTSCSRMSTVITKSHLGGGGLGGGGGNGGGGGDGGGGGGGT